MKATTLIAAKGLAYAVNIIKSAPSNATQWNEGYEFKCGQKAATISPQDREKYFVDLSDLKHIVQSLDLVAEYGGITMAKRQCECFTKACTSVGVKPSPRLSALKQAIADYEAVYSGAAS